MAEGAEPLKPLVAILSAAILINKTVVAVFRGEKKMKQSEREMLSELLYAMSDSLEEHMDEEHGEAWSEFRDKYYFPR